MPNQRTGTQPLANESMNCMEKDNKLQAKSSEDVQENYEQLNSEEKLQKEGTVIYPEFFPYSCFTSNQKYVIFGVIIFIGFLGPMSGNIYIPALPILQREFGVSETTINATVSVFMAVFSVGPLFWGLFADVGGRKILYLISLTFMVIINLLLAVVPSNIGALYVLRIAQAFASSSVMALGAGTVTDLVEPKHRGKAIGYFMLGPNLGPILAPIITGLILLHGNYWRWLFGFTTIMSAAGVLTIIILLPETLRCIVGNADPRWKDPLLFNDVCDKDTDSEVHSAESDYICHPRWKFCGDIGFLKPVCNNAKFKELYPHPPKAGIRNYWNMVKLMPVLLTSLSTAVLFAGYYAFSVTFSHFLTKDYGFSLFHVGLAYICPGVFLMLGSQIGGHLSDFMRTRWMKQHDGQKFPLEFRLVLNVIGVFIHVTGIIGYGWSIQKHYHLVVVFVFSAFTAFGMTWCSNTTMTYLTELMSRRAAGTVAVSSFFRNIAAAISSAIIIKLCDAMGIGWCFTGLGLVISSSAIFIIYLIKFNGKWQNIVH